MFLCASQLLGVVMQIQDVIADVFGPGVAFRFLVIRHECFHVVDKLLARYFAKSHPVEDVVQFTIELIREFEDFVRFLQFLRCSCGVFNLNFLIASGQGRCQSIVADDSNRRELNANFGTPVVPIIEKHELLDWISFFADSNVVRKLGQ